MIYGLDLFSGIGGISLALKDLVCPVAYCEIEPYCQAVLLQRQAEGKLHRAPIWPDIKTLRGSDLPEVDIVYAGFPCQDISVAGIGKGLAGERSGLFFDIVRLIEETNAPWVFLENVPAIRTRGLKKVIGTLADLGYDCRWTGLSASSVGALHKRERWFLLANANSARCLRENASQPEKRNYNFKSIGPSENVAHSISKGLEGQRERTFSVGEKEPWFSSKDGWKAEPNVGRVVDGLPFRVDRIKSLGNSVVPLQARFAFEKLIGEGAE